MKFTVITCGDYYKKEDSEKLKKLGFEFVERKGYYYNSNLYPIEIDFNCIYELLDFVNEWGPVEICQCNSYYGIRLINIYNKDHLVMWNRK